MSIAYMILDFRKTQTILEIKESTETQFNVPFVLLDITFFWCPDEQYFILIQSLCSSQNCYSELSNYNLYQCL